MIHRIGVQSSGERVQPLEVNIDTVYKRYNIQEYTDAEGNVGFIYDEDELTLIEYFRQTFPDNEEAISELSFLFAAYQQQTDQAIGELSQLIGGINNV